MDGVGRGKDTANGDGVDGGSIGLVAQTMSELVVELAPLEGLKVENMAGGDVGDHEANWFLGVAAQGGSE